MEHKTEIKTHDDRWKSQQQVFKECEDIMDDSDYVNNVLFLDLIRYQLVLVKRFLKYLINIEKATEDEQSRKE
jgi:hypothetical protein